MKIFAISDLHLEFYNSTEELWQLISKSLPDADVLILAGDIGYPHNYVSVGDCPKNAFNLHILLSHFKKKYARVILIAGNHEVYQTESYRRSKELDCLRRLCEDVNVYYLDKSSVVIDDVEFFGCTLWSAIEGGATSRISDFQKAFSSHLDYLEEFISHYTWLRQALKNKTKEKNVVITHHLPSRRLIAPIYTDRCLNTAFATSILDEIDLHNVQLFVCGHSHTGTEMKYGDTFFFLNPLGYPSEISENSKSKVPIFSTKTFEV
jgi:UDP-2,3-diacylglucosamine pyrophosphatase LpxH